MQRREFISLLGGAAATWPLAARAQQPAMPVVGFLHPLSPENVLRPMTEFHQGLKEGGYIEGQNLAIEYRWAHGYYDRLPELAADLVRRRVAIIVATGGDPAPQIAKAATQTIPIVFGSNGDPVKAGIVASLSRPGGNATGVTIFGVAAVTKRLQLLHDLVPQPAVFAYLRNPNNPFSDIEMAAAKTAATSLGRQIVDPFFFSRRDRIVSLAAQYRLPAIYYLREFAEAGGLMSYGNNIADAYRIIGIYVGRILKGEKPADLPVQEATKFELLINFKTAKALGIEVPNSMQLLADEVIE